MGYLSVSREVSLGVFLKKIAILQSNYIPWRGYFDLIGYVDEFVIFDDMQYTKGDWRNRNQIKTPNGLEWLTIPVQVKGKYNQKISEVQTDGSTWISQHLKALERNYARSKSFEEVMPWILSLYSELSEKSLSEINLHLIREICLYLGISTPITLSTRYSTHEDPSSRLAQITREAGGAVYVSGPAARSYLNEGPFIQRDLRVDWFNYGNYSDYPQLWGEFKTNVSVLDLILNCGTGAPGFLRFVQK
jgi:hypothetical protein